ncbi:MAG: ribonuclease R [Clostridiales Family XIII bacterium]|nr:ribonuclease R [Clostridiales Family XIII bacterium]
MKKTKKSGKKQRNSDNTSNGAKSKSSKKRHSDKHRGGSKFRSNHGEVAKFSTHEKKKSGIRLRTGILTKNKKGFGFVIPDEGGDDMFVPLKQMNGAMHGDKVEVLFHPEDPIGDRKSFGMIKRVIERNTKYVIGIYKEDASIPYVQPISKHLTDEPILIRNQSLDAESGDTVGVTITKFPTSVKLAEGKITELIAKEDDEDSRIKAILRGAGIEEDFLLTTKYEADQLPEELIVTDDMLATRKDIRDDVVFTIDGPTAKDFDDAVSIKKLENGNYLLGVHIADVTHYVTYDSALDREAYYRGTSIYIPGTVIPMLPEVLSNGLCSLKPDVDRLTLSVDMEVDSTGHVIQHKIYESIIHSNYRLIYDDVSDIIEQTPHNEETVAKYNDILWHLQTMNELYEILTQARDERGSIEFDIPELELMIGENHRVTSIEPTVRRTANKLIEEFMLLANETVAKEYAIRNLPFVYRVHERPDTEKMSDFLEFLSTFSYHTGSVAGNITPKSLNSVMKHFKGEPDEQVISKILLRTMQKARYSEESLGHFGLALRHYAHFTSPIRRYPDLFIHRMIKDYINKRGFFDREKPTMKKKELMQLAVQVADQSSKTEATAVEIEREVESYYVAEYMSERIGNVYDAVISGVTSFGLFAQTPEGIEGLIRLDDLSDDYYSYDKQGYMLKGENSGRTYRLGDLLRIEVAHVDVALGEIDFLLI